jgi:hypothetical protein
MNEPVVPEVADDEKLARYVYSKRHIREDQTVRPDAFIPHPYPDLSVNRHRDQDEPAIWRIGTLIGEERAAPLLGRADVVAGKLRQLTLDVKPAPDPGNPNHANVVGWPIEKPRQKNLAQKIVLDARFFPMPG